MAADVVLQRYIEYRCGKRDPGIQLFLEDQRNALAEHIAQYAAENAGDDRSNRGDNRAFAHIQAICAPMMENTISPSASSTGKAGEGAALPGRQLW